MKVVLVCIGVFQDYILDTIQQLQYFDNYDITVLTNEKFKDKFSKIEVISVESLDNTLEKAFYTNTRLDKQFRGGFWLHCFTRFIYIAQYMKQYDVENIIHIENDIALYLNLDEIKDKLTHQIHLVMDNQNRCIPSIMFFQNYELLEYILEQYIDDKCQKNDMEFFANTFHTFPGLVSNFPIFWKPNSGINYANNFDTYNGIFDAAAMGQYLGGVDPRNQPGDTSGFVNETCIIKYDTYQFIWKNIENKWRIYIVDGDKEYRVFNLHIHCKNLKQFLSITHSTSRLLSILNHIESKIENKIDVVIPYHSKDYHKLIYCVQGILKNIEHNKIYLVGKEDLHIPDTIFIDEKVFPYWNKIDKVLNKKGRIGWVFQQLIKLMAWKHIPTLKQRYLVVDSDTIFSQPVTFIDKMDRCLYNVGMEYNELYFQHMFHLHPTFTKQVNESGICHHMVFDTYYLKEMMSKVEEFHEEDFVDIFLEAIDDTTRYISYCSEYELYFNYMLKYHREKIQIRKLDWYNGDCRYKMTIEQILEISKKYDYISYHDWE